MTDTTLKQEIAQEIKRRENEPSADSMENLYTIGLCTGLRYALLLMHSDEIKRGLTTITKHQEWIKNAGLSHGDGNATPTHEKS